MGRAGRHVGAESHWSLKLCLVSSLGASVDEALRAIKTLCSDKAPLVKKRQLMRAMFGDYRKKMEEELCKELKLMEAGKRTLHDEGRENENALPFILLYRAGPCYTR